MQFFPEKGWSMIIIALIALILCTGAVWLCKKYFPFALGKVKLKEN